MSIRQTPTGDFDTDLTQQLPRLRIYALSLTRDSVRADDLVQQTVVRSLAGRKSSARAPTSRAGCSASSATSSSRACAASGRPSS